MALRGADGPHSPSSKPERITVTEAWQVSTRNTLIQLDCIRQVCWTAELCNAATRHSRNKGIWAYGWVKGSSDKELGRSGGFAADKNIYEWGKINVQNEKKDSLALSDKFRLCDSRIVLSLQFRKLINMQWICPNNTWANCREKQQNALSQSMAGH